DADIVIVCYGIASRTVYSAVETAREKGFKVGLFRPITLWPFPEDKIYDISLDINKFIVIEMNLGQIYHSVLEYTKGNCQVEGLFTLGGQIPKPKEILKKIRKR
ncbi:MAG: hypothetical protein GF311_12270, partial [Candidatus Lokiarchaeota archaeon]|nr:hypothetical protein [Candidatus Lokiarchaeota archaeon]